MANIDFNDVLTRIGDTHELIVSCPYPHSITNNEVLYLTNFPEERYALFIYTDGFITGPCSDCAAITANKSLLKKLAGFIFRRPSNNMLYIIDKRPIQSEFPNYLHKKTVSVLVEHGAREPVSFSISYKVQFRLNPDKIEELVLAYFSTEITSANEYFLRQFHQIVSDAIDEYFDEYTETLNQINTYEGLLRRVEAIESNINRLTQNVTAHFSNDDNKADFRFYLVERFEILISCNEKDHLLQEVNSIAGMRRKQDKLLEEQRLQEELQQRQLAADIKTDETKHKAQLDLQNQSFEQEQQQAAIVFKTQQEQANVIFEQQQRQANIAFSQEQQQARIAIETQTLRDRAAIDTSIYEQTQQLNMDLKREDMMFSIETRKQIRQLYGDFVTAYIKQFAEAYTIMHNSFDVFINNNGGIVPEDLLPVVDALKALNLFTQPDHVVNEQMDKITGLLRLENVTEESSASSTADATSEAAEDLSE